MANDIIIGNEEFWDEDHAHDMVLNSMVDDLSDEDIKEIIESNDNKGTKVRSYILTTIEDSFWITAGIANLKGKITEDNKEIVNSIKIKNKNFQTQSRRGLFVNSWPAFSVSYPEKWIEKLPESPFIFFAESPDKKIELRAGIVWNINQPLKNKKTRPALKGRPRRFTLFQQQILLQP